MGRVGLVGLSIAVATVLLVGASYGAEWLAPYFAPLPWRWIAFSLLPMAVLLMRPWRLAKGRGRIRPAG